MNAAAGSKKTKGFTNLKRRMTAIGLSLTVAVLLLTVKFYTYWLTGSAARMAA